MLLFQTMTRIVHLDYHGSGNTRRFDYDLPGAICDSVDGIETVDEQVQQDLLQLHAVAENHRQISGEFSRDFDMTSAGFKLCEHHDVPNNVVKIEKHYWRGLLPKQ